MKTPSLLRSMMSFSAMTFVSRLLGLVREQVIAGVFGANWMTDAFLVAFRIPNFMRRLFAEGSFSTAFVPVLTEVKEKRTHEELRDLVSRTAGTLGGVLLIVTAIGVIGADQLTAIFAPGALLEQPEKFRLTSDLLRITFPFLMLVSLTALASGVLNSFHRFALPALTPVILNLCMIGAAFWLAPKMAIPITSLAWAVLLAGVLQVLFQLPALRKLDLLTLPRWGWSHPDVRRILRLMIPTLFGSSVAQVNLLLDTLIASFLIVGSQTWLGYSDRLLEFPLGMFGVALGTVILPSLSRHHVNTDRAGFSRALDWGLRTTLLISIPAMIGLDLPRQTHRRHAFPARQIHRARCRHGRIEPRRAEFRIAGVRARQSARARVLRAAGHEDAGQGRRRRDDREHGAESALRRRALFVLARKRERIESARRHRVDSRFAHGHRARQRAGELSESVAALEKPFACRRI